MEYVGHRGIEKLLNDYNDIDYVASVMTPWHVIALKAAVQEIEDERKTSLKGIIMLVPHASTGLSLNESDINGLNAIVYIYKNDENVFLKIYRELRAVFYYCTLKKDGRKKPFYVFDRNRVRYAELASINSGCKNRRNIIDVKIDEGVGTYIKNEEGWLQINLQQRHKLKQKLEALIVYAEFKLLKQNKIIHIGNYKDRDLLIKTTSDLCIPNGNMPSYFKAIIEHEEECTNIDVETYTTPYIIFNTQPMEEIDISSQTVVLEVLKRCIKIIQEKGYTVVIKPHPREKNLDIYRNMGVEILEHNEISQEMLLATFKIKPSYVIGYYSTTLVTSNVIFRIPTISIADILTKTGCTGNEYKKTIIDFKKSFSNMVFIPNSYKQFAEILDKT